MKRKTLLMLLLMALFAPLATFAQTTVEIGNGTAGSNRVPIDTYYNYSITEQLYTADEIGMAGTITSISFNYINSTVGKDFPIEVYMQNVDAADLSTGGISLADADLVFEGTLSVTEAGLITIDLDSPFVYDGTSNLLIGVIKGYVYWFSGNTWQCTATDVTMARYSENDNNTYDTSTTPSSASANRPNIQMEIIPGGGVTCSKPTQFVVSNVTAHTADLAWESEASSWQIMLNDDESNLINVNTTSYNLTGLTAETSYNVKVRAKCGSDYSAWTSKNFTTTIACPVPTGLTVTLTPGNATTATLSWTESGSATNWVLEYGTASDFTGATSVNVSGTPSKVLAGLTPETVYYAHVKAACGGDDGESAWSTATNFEPTEKLVIGSGTTTNSNLPSTTCYNYSLSQQIYTAAELGEASAILSIDLYSSNGATKARKIDIYMVSTNKSSFENTTDWIAATAADLVFSTNEYTWQLGWNSFELDSPFNYDGTSNVAIVVCDEKVTNYECSTSFRVFEAASQAIYARNDNDGAYDPSGTSITASGVLNTKNQIRILKGEPPACPKPAGLAVNYEGGTTASVTWNGAAASYQLDVNGTTYNTNNTTYNLTGLELATTYEVKVRANCGSDGYSDWTGPVSFTTDLCMPEDQCALTFNLVDSYGDGWNGASIDIYDYTGEEIGDLLASITLSSGTSATQTLSFCDGQELAIIWTEGGYDSECSYIITDINGDIVAQDDVELALAYTIDCTETDCRRPSDFVASEIGPHSVVLSWTENGPATQWQIEYISENDEETTVITVDTNPYTLTGLTSETYYAAQVTPVCEVDKPSEVITWTTDVACPNPSQLNVTATPTAADVTWTGYADAYDLEWALLPATGTKDPYNDENWYYYDNGTYEGSVGLGGGEFHWGVMFPAGTYEGTLVSKVKAYDINAMVGTLAIYNDGETAPDNQISIQDIEFTGIGDWVEFSTFANIDPSKNVWIVFDAVDGAAYPIGTSSDDNGDANGRWVEINGTWYDMGSVGVEDRANMVRAYIELGVDPNEIEWNPVSGVTSPYTITGLEPETTYIVRVKAICGGDDGESTWTTMTFTTPSACETPINLTADPIAATSATLNWSDYQDSYNLQYRYAQPVDPNTPATIILEAHNVWGEDDLSGYQMLLDADATTYGTIIPTSGGLTTSGDASEETYAEFEYKIPVNADGAMTTENIVFDGSVTIQIPAGTYDWCITNPTPGDRIWIASGNGNVNGRQDDFVFEPGVTYLFVVSMHGSNDGVDLTITRPMSDWMPVSVNEVPYVLTGLTPNTLYEWQVQGVNKSCTGGVTEWSELANFTTLEASAEEDQTITLPVGWGWFSSYIEYPADALEQIQNGIALNNTTATIKGQYDFVDFSGNIWTGGLETLANEQMYLIKCNGADASLTGPLANPADHPITLKNGWNWIGYISPNAMTVTEALASVNPGEDDMIKGQNAFSTYTSALGWAGALETLTPGEGYIYRHTGSNETLVYPTTSKGVVATTPAVNYWNANHNEFQTNLSMMVTLDGQYGMFKGSHEIGAFVGGECRGSARLQEVGGKYIAFLTVSGNQGEEVCFKLFDVTNNKEYASLAAERIVYSADAIYGSVKEPMTLHFNMTGVEEYEGYISLFPNPAKDKVMVNGNGIQTLKVYNAMGQLIHEEDCSNAEQVELNIGSFSSGVYTVNVVMTNGQTVNKMMVKE